MEGTTKSNFQKKSRLFMGVGTVNLLFMIKYSLIKCWKSYVNFI